MFWTLLFCSFSILCFSNNQYKIQIGSFVKKVPFTHFAFSGVNNIYMDVDQNNIYRYYLRAIFKEYPIAARIKDSLIVRGFSNATIITVKEEALIKPIESSSLPTLVPKNSDFSKTIYFGFAQFDLKTKAKKELDKLCKNLKKNPHITVAIIGHTDSQGSALYNIKLSKNRVRSVKQYLIKKGIPKSQLEAKACGEANPVLSNRNESGADIPKNQQYNRRVVIITLNTKGELIHQLPTGQIVHPVLERVDLKD